MSPAMTGGFLTTVPPGKSRSVTFGVKMGKTKDHVCIYVTFHIKKFQRDKEEASPDSDFHTVCGVERGQSEIGRAHV